MVVEDDVLLREVTCDLLRLTGYVVLSAASPDEALQLTADRVGPIDFILTDMMMPNMNGRELVLKLAELGHRPRVLYVSGYTDVVMSVAEGSQNENLAFLQKPYTRFALTTKVREILDLP